MAMTAKAQTLTTDRTAWTPENLLGVGLSVYVISLALYWGLRPDTALSVYTTEGAAQFIAIGYVTVGVFVGLTCMAAVMLRNSLSPMSHLSAYLLAYATLACFRIEETWTANVVNAARFLAMSAVAAGAWLYHVREASRAHQ